MTWSYDRLMMSGALRPTRVELYHPFVVSLSDYCVNQLLVSIPPTFPPRFP